MTGRSKISTSNPGKLTTLKSLTLATTSSWVGTTAWTSVTQAIPPWRLTMVVRSKEGRSSRLSLSGKFYHQRCVPVCNVSVKGSLYTRNHNTIIARQWSGMQTSLTLDNLDKQRQCPSVYGHWHAHMCLEPWTDCLVLWHLCASFIPRSVTLHSVYSNLVMWFGFLFKVS